MSEPQSQQQIIDPAQIEKQISRALTMAAGNVVVLMDIIYALKSELLRGNSNSARDVPNADISPQAPGI